MSKPTALVTGATGNQGGAVVDELLRSGRTHVRAMTRDPSGASAQRLAARGVEVVGGDFGDPASLDAALTGVTSAFSVQALVEDERPMGIAMADAVARRPGVVLVYSSVDGAERDSGIPHFENKWAIEQHIQKLGVPATVLRPVAFMENLAGPSIGRAFFLGLLRAFVGDDKGLQLVSVRDIGWFGARALEDPGEWAGRVQPIAGDERTVPQIRHAWRDARGRAPWPVPVPRWLAERMLPDDLRRMLAWFAGEAYTVDIAAVREQDPGLLDLPGWLAA